jgi:transcriptional regulator with XRE-family HTH domain
MSVIEAPSQLDGLTLLADARKAARSGRGRRLRQEAGFSQAEIGAFCGVTATAISLWENDKRTPRGEAARRYAHVIQALEERAGRQ